MSVIVLDSFDDDVDVRYDPALDGDDADDPLSRTSLLSHVPPPPRTLMAVRGLLAPATTIVVPYVPGIGQGDVSDGVYAVKRAYARSRGGGRLAKLMSQRLSVRRTWGKAFSTEIGSTSYTKALHVRLAPHYDALALSLLHEAASTTGRDRIIARQVAWHTALYNRRYQVPYSQLRPSQLVSADRVTRADCSGSVAGGCAWAEILPHVDWRYTNTWSQITFGTAVSGVADAVPGDVFLYGSPSHEALYLGGGLVWSFGSFPAKILPHDYRHDRRAIRRFVPK